MDGSSLSRSLGDAIAAVVILALLGGIAIGACTVKLGEGCSGYRIVRVDAGAR